MAKKKRSRINKASGVGNPAKPEAVWSELEQEFFASAPPEVPTASAQPETFDDLDDALPAKPGRRQTHAELQQAAAAIKRIVGDILMAPHVNLRTITIAVASVMLLIGLSAVVFASR
jgi:hypothetical protein